MSDTVQVILNQPGPISVVLLLEQGPAGAQGPQGPQGIQGPAGQQGVPGTPGTNGVRGSLWYRGTGAPGVIAGALLDDQYLDTASGNVWTYSGTVWTESGNIQGPQGIQGVQGNAGANGTNGVRGSLWYQGNGAPTVVGSDLANDQYLDNTTGNTWTYSGTAWAQTGNIRGPQGVQGVQGPQGPQGNPGVNGVTSLGGATGVIGLDSSLEIVDGNLKVSGASPSTAPTVVQVAYSNNSTSVTFNEAPTEGNLLLAFYTTPDVNGAASGWTFRDNNPNGEDYGGFCTKIAGASESTVQTPIPGSTSTIGLTVWEIHGQNLSAPYLSGVVQVEGALSTNTLPLYAISSNTIVFFGYGGYNGNITSVIGGTTDVLENGGSRNIYAGHYTTENGPFAAVSVIAPGSDSKGGSCIITA